MLGGLSGSYKVRLFTLNKNEGYEWDEVKSTRLANLNFTFPSVNRNSPDESREAFAISYKNKYGVTPNRFAVRGFDVTYDVLLRLAADSDIYKTFSPEDQTVYIENKFRYEKSNDAGYSNQAGYILKYDKDLKFEIVE